MAYCTQNFAVQNTLAENDYYAFFGDDYLLL